MRVEALECWEYFIFRSVSNMWKHLKPFSVHIVVYLHMCITKYLFYLNHLNVSLYKKGHLQGPTATLDAAVSDLYNFLWPQNWPSSLNCKNSVSVILSTPVLIRWQQWPSGSCDVDSLCSLTFLNTNKVAQWKMVSCFLAHPEQRRAENFQLSVQL